MRRPTKSRSTLLGQVFVAILLVTMISVFATGLIARYALSNEFADYVGGVSSASRGMGRVMLGTAEQSFLASMDKGIMISSLIAVIIAIIGALLLARYLTRPLAQLTSSAREFEAGDLDHRVELGGGPLEVAELAEAFNDMAISLAQAEELRRRMVADVAHELRNPIASLRAQVEAVAEGVLEMDDARAASLVVELKHLSRLVEDLQELSIAEAGRLRYAPAKMDLTAAVDREIERSRPLLSGEVELRRTGDAVIVEADEDRLAQVIRNLVSNAARHTSSGSITVNVSKLTREGTPSVRVAVEDTGEGIPAEDLPYVFERFYRADSSRAVRTGGAGIGLAISRRIIEDHGGSVFAHSEPEARTVVGFEIPAASGLIADFKPVRD